MLIYGLNDYYFKIPIIDEESLNKYRHLCRVERVEATKKISRENYYKEQGFHSRENTYYDFEKFYTVSMIRALSKELYEKALDLRKIFGFRKVKSAEFDKVDGCALDGALKKVYNIRVKTAACCQENRSRTFRASRPAVFSKGENIFIIEQDKRTRYIKFSVKRGESNEDILRYVCKAIKKADLMLEANVVKNEKKDIIYLEIYSKNTGKRSSFEIKDKFNNIVKVSGINRKVKKAKNAEYIIDNNKFKAQNNVIKMNKDKVTLNIKEECEDVKVKVVIDEHKAVKALEDFIASYNDLINKIDKNQLNKSCVKHLWQCVTRNLENSNSIGIVVEQKANIKLIKQTLLDSLKDQEENVRKTLIGEKGIISKIATFFKNVYKNPMVLIYDYDFINYDHKCNISENGTANGKFINFWA